MLTMVRPQPRAADAHLTQAQLSVVAKQQRPGVRLLCLEESTCVQPVTAQQSCQAAGAYHGSAAIGFLQGVSAFYSECIHAMAPPHAGSLEVFLDQLTYSFGQHIGPA